MKKIRIGKKALRKDFYMEIKKTANRFISIMLIVFLGVAFFSGIRAAKPDMQISADAFYDESNLMDVQIKSTLGLTKEDLDAIRSVEGVKEAVPAYSLDVFCSAGDSRWIVRLMSKPDKINKIHLKEGRLPDKSGECLADEKFIESTGYKIGDKVSVEPGTEDPLEDSLNAATFEIVGIGTTSYYLSLERGTSSIGNGQLNSFLVIPVEDFNMEVYTEINLTVKGAAELLCYDKEYENTVDAVTDGLKAIKKERCEERYRSVMDEANEEINEGKQKLADAKKKLSDGKQELKDGYQKIQEAKAELADKEKEFEDANAEIKEKEDELERGKRELENGYAESKLEQQDQGKNLLDENRRKLEFAENALAEGKRKLQDGEVKLQEGKQKLQDAEKEYNEGKAEYDQAVKENSQKIKDAEADIKQGKADIAELEVPKWYIMDRQYIKTFVEYGSDADRIGSIGEVFPAIFFLVAALVSLTTMTRMVEEERLQIGTLKALGYHGFDIAKKYLYYALLASIFGSVAGFLIGQKLLPYIIINAYGILYNNLPEIQLPINAFYAWTSTLAAVACTLIATIFACYKETASMPSKLMRPVTIKAGKRVILEKIPFLWKHLNFSKKATVRNLLRYKKRFFMTVFGIGGCTALLVVGFGVRDSIMSVGNLQFGNVMIYDTAIGIEEKASVEKRNHLQETLEAEEAVEKQLFAYETSVDVSADQSIQSAYLVVPENEEELNDFLSLQNRITGERYILGQNGAVISEKMAKLLGVKVGDTVTLKKGESEPCQVTVAGISENYFAHYIYLSNYEYQNLYGEPPNYNQLYTKNKEGAAFDEEKFAETYMEQDGVESVVFVKDTADRVSDMLKSMNVVIYVLVISAGLLNFVVLYNLNNINISERIRELATLKVLGFYDMEVSQYVYRENTLLTLVGAVAGIGIGVLLHRFVIVTAEIDTLMFGREVNGISFIISILLTFVFSAFVNLVMHFKLKKINMVESMKSIE